MPTHELAALLASLCFAVAGLLAVVPSRTLGAVRFNRVRMLFMAVVLFVLASLTGGLDSLVLQSLPLLILSGLVGIFLGDTFLFAALRRVGPRRNAIMFALNAPLSVIAGIYFLDEMLSFLILCGCLTVTAGVTIALIFGPGRFGVSSWDKLHGSLPVGLLYGFLAATGQAAGIILTRPLMDQGIDPIAAAAVRVTAGGIALFVAFEFMQRKSVRDHSVWTRQILFLTLGSGIIGMGFGMTLVLYGLSGGQAGIISTLSSAAPIFMIPVLWIASRQLPVFGSWTGALIVFLGTAMIMV